MILFSVLLSRVCLSLFHSFVYVYHVVWLNRFFYVLLSITQHYIRMARAFSVHWYIYTLQIYAPFFFHYLDRIFAFVIGKILCRYSPHSCWRKIPPISSKHSFRIRWSFYFQFQSIRCFLNINKSKFISIWIIKQNNLMEIAVCIRHRIWDAKVYRYNISKPGYLTCKQMWSC